MKKKYFQILLLLNVALLLFQAGATAQSKENDNDITIESVVQDTNGNPIPGAVIYGNEGNVVVKADASGKFRISIPSNSDLMIEAEGHEPVVFKASELKNTNLFSLKPALFYFGPKDDVNITFGKIKRGNLVNAAYVLDPKEIMKYDNIQDVTAALSGRVPGMLGSSNIRGLGAPAFIVDGLPRDVSTINLAEVEQITVLKDINSAILYGNTAVNGLVLVTTKRGQPYKRQLNVTGYYGLSKPRALPKYLPSAEYMTLFNEARQNDGLSPLYTETDIQNYTSGNKYRYPDVDYYSDEYLKPFKPFSRVMTEVSGGNNLATYYSNVSWEQVGSLLDFGVGKKSRQNIFNVRGNVDFKFNDWIKNALDAVAVYDNTQGPVGTSYWSSASTLQPNLFSPLIPISMVDPENAVLKARKNDVNGMYLLGGTTSYLTNPIANGYSGGENDNVKRTFSFNNRIDFDLNQFIEGLAFHTNFSFDFFSRFDQAVTNTYSVYSPVWNAQEDLITGLNKYGSDARPGTQNVANQYFERRFGFYGMFDYKRTFNEVHSLYATLLGYGNTYRIEGDIQGNKNMNLGLRLIYGYNNKYLVDFSSAYVNSAKLPEGNQGGFSPSLGLAWVVSEEDFLSSATAIDYLKLKISAGIMNSDLGMPGYYYYDNRYNTSGSFSWHDGSWSNSQVVSAQGPNPNLHFEKRNELNLGLEGIFFNHALTVDANLFASAYYDQITRPQTMFPSFFTTFAPYENFDKNSYKGAELGLSYTKKLGDFSFVLGANGLYATSKVVERDEIYTYDYQYRAGKPLYARFGLEAEGLFMDQTEIDKHPVQAFGAVQPGDIKYVDQNDDGIIDSDDEVEIGLSQAPFYYGLNLRMSFKNLTLFVHGTGSMGVDSYISGNYYWVDGNDKYTEYVRNRWRPDNKATATFPRLSAVANSNNFRNSTYWLYRDNSFTINRVQLTYDMPDAFAQKLLMKKMSLFADGSSLYLFSKHREIKELSVGSEPYYRSFSLGVKIMF